MPITQSGDGSLVYTPINDGIVTALTGSFQDDSFSVRDPIRPLKQIQFDPSPQADKTIATIQSSPEMLVSTIYTLPQLGGSLGPADPANGVVLFDDFIAQNVSGDLNWGSYGTATTSSTGLTSGHPGIVYVGTSTATDGFGGMYLLNSVLFGAVTLNCEMLLNIPTLSTDSQQYTFRAGFGDSYDGITDNNNGVYFEYIHSANSGNWVCKTANNGTRTTLNSTIAPVAGAWTKLKFSVSASNVVSFYVDGVLAGTISTNVPTASGRSSGPLIYIIKSAGATERRVYMDYFYTNIILGTAR